MKKQDKEVRRVLKELSELTSVKYHMSFRDGQKRWVYEVSDRLLEDIEVLLKRLAGVKGKKRG